MNRTLSIAAVAMIALAAGCQNSKPSSLSATPTVATLPPAEPMPAPAVEAAATEQPIDTSTPAMGSEISPSSGSFSSGGSLSSGGSKYTVKAGDTLYHIAVSHYGSGKNWKKIAAANPGIDPSHLKVGQKLILP